MPRSQHPPYLFRPFDLPAEAIRAMPRQVQPKWAEYRKAVDQHTLAEAEAGAASTALRDAPRFDREAADQAVAKGKPIPDPTLPKAQHVFDIARRAADAQAAHADRQERAWLQAAEGHRPEWLAAVNARLDNLIDDATAALEQLREPLTDLAAVEAVRVWLRPYPAHRLLGNNGVGSARPIGESLREVAAQVEVLRPARVDANLAADLAEADRRDEIRRKYPQGVVPSSVDPATVT